MAETRNRLAQARKAQGYTQEALAEALHVDRSTVVRWETTGSQPQPYLWPKLARCLRVSAAELRDLLAESVAPRLDRDERLAYALQHPQSLDLVTVAQLRQQVHELDERYDRASSTSLLAEAGEYLGQIKYLATHAASVRVQRELDAVEAQSATLMGQLVWDASQRLDHTTAHRYFDQAVCAARRCRGSTIESLALLRKSFVALYGEHDPHTGLRLTTRTAETAAGVSDVLCGLAALHTAEAHAMLGRRGACERALSDADRHFDNVETSDTALDLFSQSQRGRLAGSCYLFLGDTQHAAAILEKTAGEVRQRSKSHAIVLGNLSLAYLRQRKLDEAAGHLHRAIDVIEQTRGGGGMNIVFGACRELRPWRRETAVQDVYDRVLSLMAAS